MFTPDLQTPDLDGKRKRPTANDERVRVVDRVRIDRRNLTHKFHKLIHLQLSRQLSQQVMHIYQHIPAVQQRQGSDFAQNNKRIRKCSNPQQFLRLLKLVPQN